MHKTLTFSSLIEQFILWVTAHIWTTNTAVELLIMASIYMVSAVIARLLHERATTAIEKSKLPLRTKRIAKNSRRIILPVVFLILLTATANIARTPWFGMDVSLMDVLMKVMLAWIVIRLALQFVENSVMRNVLTWTIWLMAALSIFGVLDQTMAALDGLAFTMGEIRVSALEVIKSIFLLMVLLYTAQFISAFFERKVLKSRNLTRSSQVLLVKIIRMALVVIAILIGVTSAGIDLSIFAVFSGALGLGIGFGLQRSVSNLFSGMLLLMDQSIKPGDLIELDNTGTFGWVNEMAARYTEIVTRDGKSYLIPNEDFVNQRVVNWSHGNSLIRLDISFGVHYRSDPRAVIKIAEEVARRPERVVDEPAPLCHLKEFGDSALNFILNFWIKDADHGIHNVKSEILLDLWDEFKARGIEIPYPHREVHIREKKAE